MLFVSQKQIQNDRSELSQCAWWNIGPPPSLQSTPPEILSSPFPPHRACPVNNGCLAYDTPPSLTGTLLLWSRLILSWQRARLCLAYMLCTYYSAISAYVSAYMLCTCSVPSNSVFGPSKIIVLSSQIPKNKTRTFCRDLRVFWGGQSDQIFVVGGPQLISRTTPH